MTTVMERPGAPGTGAGFPTVASRVRDWAERMPNAVAMREKDFGIWQEITWAETWELVQVAANGCCAGSRAG
jgi:long-chain acyl-CoA synthetase